jgi:hypothetical protein
VYRSRYPELKIKAYQGIEDKKMLITKDPDVIDKDRDEAYKNLDKLREFIEKMRRDSNQACAVLY